MVLLGTLYLSGEAVLPAVDVPFQLPSGPSSYCLGEATDTRCQILELVCEMWRAEWFCGIMR